MELDLQFYLEECIRRGKKIKYYINCKHIACREGERLANDAVAKDKTGIEWVAFYSMEKGAGRFVNRYTGQIRSTDRNGRVGLTGQVIEL